MILNNISSFHKRKWDDFSNADPLIKSSKEYLCSMKTTSNNSPFNVCNPSVGEYRYGKDLPVHEGEFARGDLSGVVFVEQLRATVRKLNPQLPESAVDSVVKSATKAILATWWYAIRRFINCCVMVCG